MDKEIVIELITAIAKALGWDYKPDKSAWTHTITKNGKAIHIRAEKNGRLVISGVWPRYKVFSHGSVFYQAALPHNVREACADITVSAGRAAIEIAKDIERRFLPKYNEVWEKLVKFYKEQTEYNDAKQRNWERICKHVDGDPRQSQVTFDTSNSWGTIYQESMDSLRIDLRSVPIDLGLKIIDMVRGK